MNQQYSVNCTRCGDFLVTDRFDDAKPELPPRAIANASGWVSENQGISLKQTDWEFLERLPTPSVGEKADKLLLYLARKLPNPGGLIAAEILRTPKAVSACWAIDEQEVFYLGWEYLAEHKNCLSKNVANITMFQITPDGWDYIHSLRTINARSQIGFCAMWFNDAVNSIWTQAIEPAIAESGYEPIVMNRYEHNNRIDDEIIATLRRSRFVVADFTQGKDGPRGGVYFEAGFALGLGLSVIHTCRQDILTDGLIHFDNRQYNFITWEHDKLPEFKAALKNRIGASIGTGEFRRK